MGHMTASEESTSTGDWLDRAIAFIVAAAVLFCPLALGAVQRWSEAVFIILACAAAVLAALRIFAGGANLRWYKLTAVPLIAFPILVGVQLLPSQWLTSIISPAAMRVRTEQLAELMDESRFLPGATITLYAEETWRHARLLCAVIAIFVAARVLARRRTFAYFLLYCMCAAGVIVGAIALAHQAVGAEKIFGSITVPRNITRVAPFMHHSHFAQFMNLSIGAALALCFIKLAEVTKSREPKRLGDWVDLAQQGELNGLVLPLVALLIGAAGIATSGSRGGALAAAVAGLLTFSLALTKRRARGPAVVGIALIFISAGSALALSSTLRDRLTAINKGELSAGDRWTLLLNQTQIWKSFPAVGTGLGTFEWVFPRYDTTRPINIASHAENEYAQMMTETGVIGFALVMMFLIGSWIAYLRLLRHGGRRSLLGLGLGYGLTAICLQSALDFGQHLPANAIMLAISIACLISASFWNDESDPKAPPVRGGTVARMAVPILALVLAGLSWQAVTAARAAALAYDARDIVTQLSNEGWRGDDQTYALLRNKIDAASALRPNDVQLLHQSAEAHYHSIVRGANTGKGLPPTVDLADIGRVLDQFDRAMSLCPMYGAPYSMAGQISFAMGDALRGGLLLDRAVKLSPQDGVTAFFASTAAARRGEGDRAVQLMRHARATSAVQDNEILDVLVEQLDRVDLAIQYGAGDHYALFDIDARLSKRPESPENSAARDAVFAALLQLADSPSADPGLLFNIAETLRRRGQVNEALAPLRRATAQRPTEIAWRFALATLAYELNDRDLARREITAVRRDRPDWPGSVELAKKLGVD